MPAPPVKPRLDGWKFRWDVVLFFAFVLSAMKNWTDLPLHEVIGTVAVPVLAIHLALNWSWIVEVLRRPSGALRGEVRFNRAWDIAQSAVALVAIVSGLAASRHLLPALGVSLGPKRFMGDVHAVSAWALMVMIGVHLGVHVPWMGSKIRKPQFALVVVLVALAVGWTARRDIYHGMGAFHRRRFEGDTVQVAFALIPAALIAYGVLVVRRRRRTTPPQE